MTIRRLLGALYAAMAGALVSVVPALPAAAHSQSGPTPYESLIVSVTPPLPAGVSVEVIDGDDMLGIRVPVGVTVDVPGYQNEPYMRVDATGKLEFNTLSSTLYLNNDRYAAVTPPEDAVTATKDGAAPEWQEYVGFAGALSWHDHRIHWMSPNLPTTVERDGKVQEWTVPVTVNGTAHTISGVLYLRPELAAAAGIDICSVDFDGKNHCDPVAALATSVYPGSEGLPLWAIALIVLGAASLLGAGVGFGLYFALRHPPASTPLPGPTDPV